MNINMNSPQSTVSRKIHCPYCKSDDAILISEITGQRTVLQVPDYGLKYWLSVIFTFGLHAWIHGFPTIEKKRVYEHTTYGFCPFCGNSYNAGVPVSVRRSERQKNKLYLNKNNKKIMGVCGSIAEFTGLSPKLVRIVMVLYGFMFLPVIIYFIAGFLMDEKPQQNNTGN